MKNKKTLAFFTKSFDLIIVEALSIIFALITLSGIFSTVELKVYDFLLFLKNDIPQRQEVLLVNIDDRAIEEIGSWPWNRDIFADALIRMKELGAATVIFDIEYLSPGQTGIDPTALETLIPQNFADSQEEINNSIIELTQAVSQGFLPVEYVAEAGNDLVGFIEPIFSDLYSSVATGLFRDTDTYFGKSIGFFENTFLTVNAIAINIHRDIELDELMKNYFMIQSIIDPKNLVAKNTAYTREQFNQEKGFTPAIYKLMKYARGAGFPNVIVDDDGARRRIELVRESDGKYISQLVFAPILHILDTMEIERTNSQLIIHNALSPAETKRRDITIPLDKNGRMLINWIKPTFEKSFRSDSVYFLKEIDSIEQNIITSMRQLATFRLRTSDASYLSYYDTVQYLLSQYTDLNREKNMLLNLPIETLKEERDTLYTHYFDGRTQFFKDMTYLIYSEAEQEIYTRLAELTDENNAASMEDIKLSVQNIFTVMRSDYDLYMGRFQELQNIYKDSFCIIGYTGVGTSDLGVTPFHRSYANVGTHANIYNTILQEEFITPVPPYISFIGALAIAFLFVLLSRNKNIKRQNIIGILSIIIVPASGCVAMMFFNIYIQVFTPFLFLFLTYIGITLVRFIFSDQEKRFLRRAFSTYLSEDIISEIINDPSKLTLGGQEKNITALFTDIRSFSTLSEKVTPEQLVGILNKYLTKLSDKVLESHGTIDKYIGDAIVAFFGAPISMEDHAFQACRTAIRMKQAEAELNIKFIESGESPMELFTRIGINSGKMVVGNMGTETKMNYTIMGNDVNLAARLEGVNKVYGTWILLSEATWKEVEEQAKTDPTKKLLARRLDRVRVVGIDTPVQLYNLLDIYNEASGTSINMVNEFHIALDTYLEKDFEKARILFDNLKEKYPNDGAIHVFLNRCEVYCKEGVPPQWDGVVNLTSK